MKKEKSPAAGMMSIPGFPIVLVTVAKNIMTAAAFSFYSFEPPCVMVGIIPKRLTFELISEKREFGINIPSADQLEIVGICGTVSGREADKFVKTGLTPMKGKVIESFLVEECPVSLECEVVHEVEFGGSHRWFIGEIKAAHIDKNYTRDSALMYWPREYRRVGEVIPVEEK
ncbi:MAG: flavin reductase family protein [Candidatus Thorarchaeota archaeon]|jgi:flavin reductase (DIM6/NTAB) family NADH-FMN oxidoreductase RutF